MVVASSLRGWAGLGGGGAQMLWVRALPGLLPVSPSSPEPDVRADQDVVAAE